MLARRAELEEEVVTNREIEATMFVMDVLAASPAIVNVGNLDTMTSVEWSAFLGGIVSTTTPVNYAAIKAQLEAVELLYNALDTQVRLIEPIPALNTRLRALRVRVDAIEGAITQAIAFRDGPHMTALQGYATALPTATAVPTAVDDARDAYNNLTGMVRAELYNLAPTLATEAAVAAYLANNIAAFGGAVDEKAYDRLDNSGGVNYDVSNIENIKNIDLFVDDAPTTLAILTADRNALVDARTRFVTLSGPVQSALGALSPQSVTLAELDQRIAVYNDLINGHIAAWNTMVETMDNLVTAFGIRQLMIDFANADSTGRAALIGALDKVANPSPPPPAYTGTDPRGITAMVFWNMGSIAWNGITTPTTTDEFAEAYVAARVSQVFGLNDVFDKDDLDSFFDDLFNELDANGF
jgi:hypothetical protein